MEDSQDTIDYRIHSSHDYTLHTNGLPTYPGKLSYIHLFGITYRIGREIESAGSVPFIAEIVWGDSGQHTTLVLGFGNVYFAEFPYDGDVFEIYGLGGDPLPTTISGFEGMLASIVSIDPIPTGEFAPGEEINLNDIPGVTISEDDTIYGTSFPDDLFGGIGNDYIRGYNADDNIAGGVGNDTVWAGDGRDSITGNEGNDILRGGPGNDKIYGGPGRDTVYGDSAYDTLYGGSGNDRMYGGDRNDLLFGGNGNDGLSGDDADDKLYGGIGDDGVSGGFGNDIGGGGTGRDRLSGGPGNDKFWGNDGNDSMSGGEGNDRLFGGNGSYAQKLVMA